MLNKALLFTANSHYKKQPMTTNQEYYNSTTSTVSISSISSITSEFQYFQYPSTPYQPQYLQYLQQLQQLQYFQCPSQEDFLNKEITKRRYSYFQIKK
ncbi:hypothetical protein RclHR1_01680008 [Rhizophagus clarus]|uniref:Uncharacterized protein n=1 Tax=Rhizophagus clarus TaxID=94130 RepID=A0A2Z6QIH6_9GLOM|nr:hypothetical protein RclHR1_01680008 [Rhizophagus clarus]